MRIPAGRFRIRSARLARVFRQGNNSMGKEKPGPSQGGALKAAFVQRPFTKISPQFDRPDSEAVQTIVYDMNPAPLISNTHSSAS
jgi:hypothetical protein